LGNPIYIHVVFPLALPRLYTYSIPTEIATKIQVGCRVEVELRNKLYAGIVYSIIDAIPENVATKHIVSVIDESPIINVFQLKLWTWIAKYYCCTLGEVMDAGIPSGLKLSSETIITKLNTDDEESEDTQNLTDDEYLVTEALSMQKELSIGQIQDILNKKSIYPILKALLSKNILFIKEQLLEKYKPKTVRMVRLQKEYLDEVKQTEACDSLSRSEHQLNTFLAIISLSQQNIWIPISEINGIYKSSAVIINALVKKGLIELEKKQISRLTSDTNVLESLPPLNEDQSEAMVKIQDSFKNGLPVLVHGITGSGKTRIYQELIHVTISKGRQVLYLLPEIALTSQIVDRLLKVFGNDILMYHSKLNDNDRVEIWNEVLKGKKLVLTARSGIFLPFTNLGLVIVDEEHDASYKQHEPNPHYNARDVALYIAYQSKCNIILGSATPSIESYQNAIEGKSSLVTLSKRYGDVKLPKIEIVDLTYERKTGRYKPVLSVPLQKEMAKTFGEKKQVILFQNRRGYVPTVQCKNCGWTAVCVNCDVNMTLHKFISELSCHYCSHKQKPPQQCPECGNVEVKEIGSGTEKIEATVGQYFPEVNIARLDLDTTKTKNALDKVIGAFSIGEIDVLVGTQMVTKGFDFDNVSLVGVIDADASLSIPDFRANERTFQLITQVAGRAGRRADQGKVVIQTYTPEHPVIKEVLKNDYVAFFKREINERQQFQFPPFVRIINIELLHKEYEKVDKTSALLVTRLQQYLGNRVRGPLVPGISRIRNQYIRNIVIKLEKDNEFIFKAKALLMKLKTDLNNEKEHRSVKIKINVDPY
jgi:primosomal protein N' (replication factor Y) (superfamily II helicase)